MYRANEATEMELGVKKISQLYKRITLNLIEKIILEGYTLHNHLFNVAKALNTKTIKYWRTMLRQM